MGQYEIWTGLETNLTVTELFRNVENLSLLGPVPWKTQISEYRAGVYVVARVPKQRGFPLTGDGRA